MAVLENASWFTHPFMLFGYPEFDKLLYWRCKKKNVIQVTWKFLPWMFWYRLAYTTCASAAWFDNPQVMAMCIYFKSPVSCCALSSTIPCEWHYAWQNIIPGRLACLYAAESTIGRSLKIPWNLSSQMCGAYPRGMIIRDKWTWTVPRYPLGYCDHMWQNTLLYQSRPSFLAIHSQHDDGLCLQDPPSSRSQLFKMHLSLPLCKLHMQRGKRLFGYFYR